MEDTSKILRYMGKRRLSKRRKYTIANFYRSRNPEFPYVVKWEGISRLQWDLTQEV